MGDWVSILGAQPEQGQHIAYKSSIGGVVTREGVAAYDRFKWEHWAIAYWKPVPQHEEDQR